MRFRFNRGFAFLGMLLLPAGVLAESTGSTGSTGTGTGMGATNSGSSTTTTTSPTSPEVNLAAPPIGGLGTTNQLGQTPAQEAGVAGAPLSNPTAGVTGTQQPGAAGTNAASGFSNGVEGLGPESGGLTTTSPSSTTNYSGTTDMSGAIGGTSIGTPGNTTVGTPSSSTGSTATGGSSATGGTATGGSASGSSG